MYWFSLIMSSVLSMVTSYIFICNVSNTNLKTILKPKKIVIFIFLTILFLLNWKYGNNPSRSIANIFILMLSNLALFNFDYKKSFFYSLIFMITASFIEISMNFFIAFLFNYTNHDYYSMKYSYVLFSIINYTVLLLLTNVSSIKKLVKNTYFVFNKLNSYVFLVFVTIYIILLNFDNTIKMGKNISFYINFFLTLFIILSCLIVTYNTYKRSKVEDKYNQMMEYLSEYEQIINEQGKRNHEFNNQLMVLEGYIDDKKKLREYLDLIIEEQKGGQNFRIKQLGALPDGGLKGLIYYKLAKMESKNIKSYLYVDEEIKDKINKIELKDYKDITKMFGVFIDNAIEAAVNSKDKVVEINISLDGDYLVIEISNTYDLSENIDKIGKKGYTSKGKGHGFGLSIVKDISNKNKNIDTFNTIEENEFKQTLMIKLNK